MPARPRSPRSQGASDVQVGGRRHGAEEYDKAVDCSLPPWKRLDARTKPLLWNRGEPRSPTGRSEEPSRPTRGRSRSTQLRQGQVQPGGIASTRLYEERQHLLARFRCTRSHQGTLRGGEGSVDVSKITQNQSTNLRHRRGSGRWQEDLRICCQRMDGTLRRVELKKGLFFFSN